MRTRVKICCISSVEEARMAMAAGADALGLVSAMPSGPGVIDEELIRHIAGITHPPVSTFLLTSKTDAVDIAAQAVQLGVSTVQIVDKLETGSYNHIWKAAPALKIVQVIHVTGEESVEEAVAIADQVDALLLDSGNPNLAVKELGGTGRVHNWELSRKIVEQASVPVFLAGGLNAENAERAIREVRPWGLDLCGGVRTDGMLDQQKLNAFFEAVHRADTAK